MFRVNKLALILASFAAGPAAFGAESEGVASKASMVYQMQGWTVTNSMVTGWFVSLGFALFTIFLIGRPSLIPSKGQAIVESGLEALRDLFEPIVGKKAFKTAFPLLVCFFFFILVQNWMGLLPGVGTLGWGHEVDGRFVVFRPLIRPFTADWNGTIALAVISFGAWLIIVLKFAGPKAIIVDLFGNKADRKETPMPLYIFLSAIFIMVGFIEVFSIFIRPFTLSVRLFGNVYGGENLLHGTGFFPVFYFMELLVGFIQALVFTLLSAVYIGLICNHGDGHEEEPGHAAH
jgi:F-type H+-transporting ATPase subunit a